MKLNPYLNFDGNCAQAFEYYQRCLGGTLERLSIGDSPVREHFASELHHRTMHACLTLGEQRLMGADSQPGKPFEAIRNCSVALHVNSIAEAERIFNALADNGSVEMPLAATFWAVRFGALTDRFGVPWLINVEEVQP